MVNSGVNTYPKYYLFGFGVNPSKKNFVYTAHVRNIKSLYHNGLWGIFNTLLTLKVGIGVHPSPTSLPSVHPHSYLENVANPSYTPGINKIVTIAKYHGYDG